VTSFIQDAVTCRLHVEDGDPFKKPKFSFGLFIGAENKVTGR
jgi:hypothetical protein